VSSRTRTTGGLQALSPSYEYDNGSIIATHAPARVGTYAYMNDVVTSGFRSRQKRGEVFFNPMSRTQRTYAVNVISDHAFGSAGNTRQYTSSGAYWYNMLPLEPFGGFNVPLLAQPFASNDIAMMLSEASTGVLSKRGRGDSNLWETAAEFGQTLDLFRKPALRLREWASLTAAGRAELRKKKDRRKIPDQRELVEDATSLWLQYRYGILPIVRDVEALIKNLQNLRKSVRKTTRDQVRRQATVGSSGVITYGVLSIPWQCQVTGFASVRGMSLDQVDWNLLDQLGFSGKSLLTLPWELVRLSFVLDWFVNVGDFLNAIAPAIGWTHIGSCAVIERSYSAVYTVGSGTTIGGGKILNSAPQGTVGISGVNRDRVPLVMPRIVVKSDFRFDSATRVADAWALSTGAVYSALGLSKPALRNVGPASVSLVKDRTRWRRGTPGTSQL